MVVQTPDGDKVLKKKKKEKKERKKEKLGLLPTAKKDKLP